MQRIRMKRILAIILVIPFLVLPAVSQAAAEPSGLSVAWKGKAPVLTAVVNWTYEGERYEMALTGLKSKLSKGSFAATVRAFHEGKNYQLTDPALTDAEKFSHLLPHRAGDDSTWVVMDNVRNEDEWGDSLQCWAASTANMLSATGWAALAKDPSGRTYPDEDTVFSYLTRNFYNEGSFQDIGVRWFFTGKADGESALREEAEQKKLLPDRPDQYMTFAFAEDRGTSACKDFSRWAAAIGEGAAMGVAISPFPTSYKLLADPEIEVSPENDDYIEYRFTELSEEEYLSLPEHYWTFDADGGVIPLEKSGESYRDRYAKEYPAMSVKKDHLFYDAEKQNYIIPELQGSAGCYMVERHIAHSADEVDLTHPVVRRALGNGSHAISVMGYIRNVSRANDGVNGLRALLIADSDNDANIWQVDAGTQKKEDRPNTYTLCYTEKVTVDGTTTLDLTNYLQDGTACIAYACLLRPKKNPTPVPPTGDRAPVGVYAALLLASGTGLCLMRKKRARL